MPHTNICTYSYTNKKTGAILTTDQAPYVLGHSSSRVDLNLWVVVGHKTDRAD